MFLTNVSEKSRSNVAAATCPLSPRGVVAGVDALLLLSDGNDLPAGQAAQRPFGRTSTDYDLSVGQRAGAALTSVVESGVPIPETLRPFGRWLRPSGRMQSVCYRVQVQHSSNEARTYQA